MNQPTSNAKRNLVLVCDCGCDELVIGHDEGFNATTVTVEACSQREAQGITSLVFAKSGALERIAPVSRYRHSSGLVVLTER